MRYEWRWGPGVALCNCEPHACPCLQHFSYRVGHCFRQRKLVGVLPMTINFLSQLWGTRVVVICGYHELKGLMEWKRGG